MDITMVHAPLDTTEKGSVCDRLCGSSEALLSWIPQWTGVLGDRPVSVAISGRIGPRISAERRAGAILSAIPSRSTSEENLPSCGFQRSV